MEIFNKPDDGRQHRRQSKDFNEIVNTQTSLETDDLNYDRIFHNWNNPEKCNGRKRIIKCKICEMIDNGESIEHLKPKELQNGN